MGRYDFDSVIERTNTCSSKWDLMTPLFGRNDLLPMWVADMDFKAPPEVNEALRERVEHGIYGYTKRMAPYYEAIVSWVGRRFDWTIEPDWICHSPGVVPALSMAILTYTQPGDGVLIQPPVYYPFFDVIGGRGRRIVENPLRFTGDRFEIDFDDLERKLDPSVTMMFLCSPHNPVGRVWTREELARIVDLCAERNVLIVADEIHSDIVFPWAKHTPIASLSEKAAAISLTTIAPSKTFNIAGLSTSAVIVPDKRLRERYRNTISFLHIDGGNTFGTLACEAAYRKGEPWLGELMEYLQGNLEFLDSFLKTNIPEIRLIRPEGTYIPFLDCRALKKSAKDLQAFFVNEAKVAMDGGDWFGTGGEGFVRMNIATPRALLREGLERIERAIGKLR